MQVCVDQNKPDGDPMKPVAKNPHSRRQVTSLTKNETVTAGRSRDLNHRRRQEKLLDDALMGTFPASDPVSSMTFVSWRDEA
jgi:hypothetical protein